LGGLLAGQRVAHLHVSAPPELHSRFVSTHPRSYGATHQRNVPIFTTTEDNVEVLTQRLMSAGG
jgi:hypothetical protein